MSGESLNLANEQLLINTTTRYLNTTLLQKVNASVTYKLSSMVEVTYIAVTSYENQYLSTQTKFY